MSAKKTVAKKAAKKTTAKKKVVAKKKSPVKKVVKKKAVAKKTVKKSVSSEQRYKMIEDAAYYLAEQSGFSGNTVDHWIRAEKLIDAQLKTK